MRIISVRKEWSWTSELTDSLSPLLSDRGLGIFLRMSLLDPGKEALRSGSGSVATA